MPAQRRDYVLWALAGLTALGIAVRFASLGVQSYHHDEVITAARVIPGSFTEMWGQVKASESNPPLYYVLAWGWAKLFGTGEVGLRSLTALFGAATVPVAFLIGRELASARAGLIGAALVALSPMLIWYSQEARSYALLVFFGAIALLYFARALRTGSGRDLGLWALASALALCSHYFAVFAVAIEAIWLLVALRSRWRVVLAAAAVVAVGLALLPLISAQIDPTHIGWIDHSPLSTRLLETGGSFLMGETGHVIAQPPRERYALIPALLIGFALLLLALRGSIRERHAGVLVLTIGAGVVLIASGIALAGSDYIVERNVLPALIPVLLAAAFGFAASAARRIGLVLASVLCVYWLAFDVYVASTPNLQRPDFRTVTEKLGSPTRPRAIVTWTLAADGAQFYLGHESRRKYRGKVPIREVDVISKALVEGRPPGLPPAFQPVERLRLERLTLTRYRARSIHRVSVLALRAVRTGFGRNAVITDGMPRW